MYVVKLEYIKPLTEVDALLDEHREWLQQHYATGSFLLSGRQVPRVGGFILTGLMPRTELDKILASDPLVVHGAARDHVTEMVASMAATPETWASTTPQE